MAAFELPRNLVAAAADDPPGSGRHAWMAELPSIVEELARRWSLVAVGWRHEEALHEADGLLRRLWIDPPVGQKPSRAAGTLSCETATAVDSSIVRCAAATLRMPRTPSSWVSSSA